MKGCAANCRPTIASKHVINIFFMDVIDSNNLNTDDQDKIFQS